MGTASLSGKTNSGRPHLAYDLSIHEPLARFTAPGTNSPSHGASLQFNSEVVGYSPNRHTTVALEGTPFPVLVVLYAGSTAE